MSDLRNTAASVLVLAATTLAASIAQAAALDGDYTGVGNAFFEKISFRSGGKVRITAMGMTKVGTYELDGKEVLITVGTETNVFTIDAKGCVVGGGFLGKYCKGGEASAGSSPAATAAPAGAALAGRYKAGDANMNITLDFHSADNVRIGVAGKQAKKESRDAKYKVAGDKVTITVPDGSPPLILTRKGNVLEGAPAGESMKMTFAKQ